MKTKNKLPGKVDVEFPHNVVQLKCVTDTMSSFVFLN